jgi:hypothetical protein
LGRPLANHDIEYEMTGKQIVGFIAGLSYTLTVNGYRNVSGNGNYVLKFSCQFKTNPIKNITTKYERKEKSCV